MSQIERLTRGVAQERATVPWDEMSIRVGDEDFTARELGLLVEEIRDLALGVESERQIARMDIQRANDRAERYRKLARTERRKRKVRTRVTLLTKRKKARRL